MEKVAFFSSSGYRYIKKDGFIIVKPPPSCFHQRINHCFNQIKIFFKKLVDYLDKIKEKQ